MVSKKQSANKKETSSRDHIKDNFNNVREKDFAYSAHTRYYKNIENEWNHLWYRTLKVRVERLKVVYSINDRGSRISLENPT